MAKLKRPTLTERRAEELRAAIARTAVEIFVADGDTSATVERIVEAAGVSPRTFYRHFPAKEDVVRPLFRASAETVIEALNRTPADGDPVDSLVAAWTSELQGGRIDDFDRRFLALVVSTPEYRLRWLEVDDDLCEATARFLERCYGPFSQTLPRTLPAYLIVQATRHIFDHSIKSDSSADITGMLRDAFRLVLAGEQTTVPR
ncbi:TetR/AcrR family transcriptional regulator [Nocardia carnea]|uniref:TetR/AcrR family transcriptional regulator n=1 Tax=Nocardia carnea TaxID=37328 RepID=UPI002455DE86|nr:TetR/AcrR family transcriptional regulator [Nocardia carnea]